MQDFGHKVQNGIMGVDNNYIKKSPEWRQSVSLKQAKLSKVPHWRFFLLKI